MSSNRRSCARSVFAEDFFASGLGQLAHLGLNALAVRRYPRFHALLMAVIYAKEKPFWIKGLIFFHNF